MAELHRQSKGSIATSSNQDASTISAARFALFSRKTMPLSKNGGDASCDDEFWSYAVSAVGIFWFVGDILVATGYPLEEAITYGDCFTYEDGHADVWERWQKAGGAWLAKHALPLAILTSEYDEHPRGRIVKEPRSFVLYADQRN